MSTYWSLKSLTTENDNLKTENYNLKRKLSSYNVDSTTTNSLIEEHKKNNAELKEKYDSFPELHRYNC